MPAAFDAIIFDCDGVLVDSEALGLDASAAYLRAHGLCWTPADLVRRFSGFRDDVFAATLTDAYRAVHQVDPPSDFFDGLVAERRKLKDELTEVPGAGAALNAVRALDGLALAVASSSRAAYLESKMRRTGLWDLAAPHIYSADLVEHGKPAPDVFLLAAARLGVAPDRAVIVEDSVNGVLAGRRAGMTVWGFLGGGHCFDGHGEALTDAGAHALIEDFNVLTARIGEGVS